MKKTLFLSTLVAFAMICSCQKQDSAAEAQLAQRKTELDAREEALAQREKAVDEREKALATSRVVQPQRQAPDAAQAEAERQKRIQQLPPELKALIPDAAHVNAARAEKDKLKQERLSRGQGGPEQLQNQRQRKFDAMQKWQMSGAGASPAAQAALPTGSPALEATSPNPSPTPE